MMSNNKYKLELTWIGKNDERQPLEPRILIENKEYSYGEPETGSYQMVSLGKVTC